MLTKLALIACVLTSTSTLAFASDILVTKTNSSGFIIPIFGRDESCRIYRDKVVIERRFGIVDDNGFSTTETFNFNVSSGIDAILAKASEAEIKQTPNMICDMPSTVISAHQKNDDAPFVLYRTGACGIPTVYREGPAAKMLIDLVNHYCELTH